MKREELNEILIKHKRWLEKSEGWVEEDRANLSKADLFGVNLRGANLSKADLFGANLSKADLFGVNLRGADLSKANLYGANLLGADLSKADLYRADLTGASLIGANLRGADLTEADLRGADLRETNLTGADLRGADNIPFIPYTCPDFGTFIGWKKTSGKIICLEIPKDARRLSGTGRKCRCDKAKVLNITELNGAPCDLTEVPSDKDKNFIYKVGKLVNVPDFDEDRWNECSAGIHFFINRQEAVKW